MTREINNNIEVEIEPRNEIFDLIIGRKRYDLNEYIHQDHLSGFAGFPIEIDGNKLGIVLYMGNMRHRHNINNLLMFIHNQPDGRESTVSKFDAGNIFRKFEGEIMDGPAMGGYGEIHIKLENRTYKDFA